MMMKFVFEKSLPSFQLVGYDENEQDEEEEKKRSTQTSLLFSNFSVRQNIHVMLSSAIIPKITN